MLRHRVYHLRSRVSLLGLELADWLVLLMSWLALKQGLVGVLGERFSLLAALLGTWTVLRLWQRVKDRVPERFAMHLMTWLGEADSYRLGPDLRGCPLVVRPAVPQETPHAPRPPQG
jgi:hypothetical protein